MGTSPGSGAEQDQPYDYADGASAVEIDLALSEAQPILATRQRRDSQVGSAYDDDGEGSVSGAIFDGYGAHAIPSSVTSMHHDRVIAWGRDRRISTSSRRPSIRRDTASTSHFRRRDSVELPAEPDDAVFASDDEAGGSPSEDGRPSIRSRSSLQQRPASDWVSIVSHRHQTLGIQLSLAEQESHGA